MRVTRNLSALSLDLSLLERERPALSANAFLSPLRSAEGICLVPAARCPAPVARSPAPAARGRGICGGACGGQNRQRGGDRGRARLRSRRTRPRQPRKANAERLAAFPRPAGLMEGLGTTYSPFQTAGTSHRQKEKENLPPGHLRHLFARPQMQLRVNLSSEKRDSCSFASSFSQCRIDAMPFVSRNSRSRAYSASNFRMMEAPVSRVFASKFREHL